MAADRRAPSNLEELQRLTKREIDRQITHVIATVAGDDAAQANDSLEPRWISAADLVRRMQPFMVHN